MVDMNFSPITHLILIFVSARGLGLEYASILHVNQKFIFEFNRFDMTKTFRIVSLDFELNKHKLKILDVKSYPIL